ncbi:hypothetical protein [Azohydromonas aeria]|uniref:hypothetical protein n=1 Tax=Azohydromonas aeria TaxID=2590212 RepID=UPI0012F9AEEF|nr:hypothetical protein [Azohydromonas aeria]
MNNFLTAVGALTLGAAAVYLSDPEQGRHRRALLKRRFAAAAGETMDAMERAGREAAAQADAAAAQLQDAGRSLLHRARALAHDAADEGREKGSQGLRQVRELALAGRERLSARLHGVRRDLESGLPRDRHGPGLGTALLSVAAVAALGAAAMYWLNPQQGRQRLAQARDRVSHLGQAMARLTHRPAQEEPPGQGAHMAELGAPADPWRPQQAPGHERDGAALH